MKKAGLSDAALCVAVQEMCDGLIDADLGGDIVKKAGCFAWLWYTWRCYDNRRDHNGRAMVLLVRIQQE